ncbi:MAG: ABC transporter substrate-binding protein [Chloroflexota bacterium]
MKGNAGRFTRFLLLLLAAVVMLAPLAACAKAPTTPTATTPGVTPTTPVVKPTIKHYTTVDLTGPYGILVPDLFEAMLDYYRYVNENGGINGYPVELVWGETGNVMARAWSHYKRFKDEGMQLMWLISSPEGEAFKSTLEKDKIFCPLNFGQSDPQLYPPAWQWVDGPSYGEGFGAFAYWVVNEWWPKNKHGKWDKPRIGIIGPDSAYGKAANLPEVHAYVKAIGGEHVGQAFPPVVPVDVTPQVMQLVKDVANPQVDWIWTQGLSQIATVWLKNMSALGLQGKVGVAGFWWTTGAELLRRIDAKFVEGYIFSQYSYMPQVEKDHPGIKKVNEMRQKYHGKDADEYYSRGVRAAQYVMEVTRIALEKFGYEGLTGANYKRVLDEGMFPRHWKTPWDLGAEIDITPNDRRTAKQLMFYVVKGGKIERMSGWIDAPHIFPAQYKDLFPGEPVYSQ